MIWERIFAIYLFVVQWIVLCITLSVQFFVLMLVLRVLCNAQLNILGIAACLVSSVQSSHPTLGAMAQYPDPGCTPWARCWVQNYRTLTSCLGPGQIRELM